MKKRFRMILLAAVLVFLLLLSGIIPVSKIKTHSGHYSDREINAAIFAARLYFALEFRDCKLIEIDYAGDESLDAAREWAKDADASEAIILISSFRSGSDWQSTGLEPDKIYQDWRWIMVKRLGFLWMHKTHGYG